MLLTVWQKPMKSAIKQQLQQFYLAFRPSLVFVNNVLNVFLCLAAYSIRLSQE